MKRREFVGGLIGAAAWPLVSRAQQPVIGWLNSGSPNHWQEVLTSFRAGLQELRYSEDQNLKIEYRWAEGVDERLPELALDLIHRQVTTIIATGGSVPVLAAKAVTNTVPIVFVIGSDPLRLGLVSSLNRPGGNITGITFLINSLLPKRLELIRELLPSVTSIGLLVNPKNPNATPDTNTVEEAAHLLGLRVHKANASDETGLGPAFDQIAQRRAQALLLLPDPLFITRREQIVALSRKHLLPAIYDRREFVSAGGLISYGTSFSDAHRQAGVYTGRILNGDQPGDLPVLQASKFELAINLGTAKTFGIRIAPSLVAQADEVIE